MSSLEEYTTPVEASSIKKGAYIVINERPTKAVDISTSKTGKHGSMKMRIVGVDIFNGKKYETVTPGSQTVLVPVIKRQEFQLSSISDDNYLSLLSDDGDLREDLTLPEGELGLNIRKHYDKEDQVVVQTTSALGQEEVSSFKIDKSQ